MKKELGISVLLIVLCGVVEVMNSRFLSPANVRNTANLIGMYGIFSIGAGIVIITGGIDLSVGSVFALQGVLLSMMLNGDSVAGSHARLPHTPWIVATLCSIAVVVLLGVFHGFMVTRARLQPFIVTLCGLLIYRGLARFLANDETKGFGSSSFGFLRPLATGSLGPVPMPFVLLILIAVVMWVVLHRSVYGRYLYAVGRNEEAARYSGINTRWVIGAAYAVAMLLAAVSGILIAFYTNSVSPSSHGQNFELYGIAAAVLGGCSLRGGEGSIIGILLGTVLLQVLQNLVILLGIPSSLNFAVTGAVILLGVTIDEVLGHRAARRKSAAKGGATPPAAGAVASAPAGTGAL